MLGAENGEQLIFSELSAKDHDGVPKASKILNCVYIDRPIDLALACRLLGLVSHSSAQVVLGTTGKIPQFPVGRPV